MREILKVCFRLVLLVGFLRFLIVEAHRHHHHHHHNHQKPRTRVGGNGILVVKKEGSGNMKQDFVEGVDYMVKRKKKQNRALSKLELNYVNKRRVPNGPDPIHNRGAGKSHRPPGHA